jgi:hypothetical protein
MHLSPHPYVLLAPSTSFATYTVHRIFVDAFTLYLLKPTHCVLYHPSASAIVDPDLFSCSTFVCALTFNFEYPLKTVCRKGNRNSARGHAACWVFAFWFINIQSLPYWFSSVWAWNWRNWNMFRWIRFKL